MLWESHKANCTNLETVPTNNNDHQPNILKLPVDSPTESIRAHMTAYRREDVKYKAFPGVKSPGLDPCRTSRPCLKTRSLLAVLSPR